LLHLRGPSSETFISHLHDNLDHLLPCRELILKKNIEKYCWKQRKQCWDILDLIELHLVSAKEKNEMAATPSRREIKG
jgi:hypothetical protein